MCCAYALAWFILLYGALGGVKSSPGAVAVGGSVRRGSPMGLGYKPLRQGGRDYHASHKTQSTPL
jgi:hypothetical protein